MSSCFLLIFLADEAFAEGIESIEEVFDDDQDRAAARKLALDRLRQVRSPSFYLWTRLGQLRASPRLEGCVTVIS